MASPPLPSFSRASLPTPYWACSTDQESPQPDEQRRGRQEEQQQSPWGAAEGRSAEGEEEGLQGVRAARKQCQSAGRGAQGPTVHGGGRAAPGAQERSMPRVSLGSRKRV